MYQNEFQKTNAVNIHVYMCHWVEDNIFLTETEQVLKIYLKSSVLATRTIPYVNELKQKHSLYFIDCSCNKHINVIGWVTSSLLCILFPFPV